MGVAKIAAGDALKFLGKLTYPRKVPCPLDIALSIFRDSAMPEFSVCCSDQWWTTLLVLANLEYALATV
jgi:hypothetical protein